MTAGHAEARTEVLPALTGVRGVAALAVFLCHAQPIALRTFGLRPDAGLAVIGSGFRGVDLFFVLSGFVLCHVHGRDFARLRSPEVTRFYLLRFFRVYPLNAFVLLLLAPLPILWPQFVEWHRLSHLPQGAYHARDFSSAAFVQSLALAQTWTGLKLGTWNEPAWTLSAEVFGYGCFPLLARLVGRLRSSRDISLLVSASLSGFVLLMTLGGHATDNPSGIFGLIRMASCFLAGIGLCRLRQLNPRLERFAGRLGLLAVLGVGLCLWQTRFGALSVFGFAALIFSLAYRTGPVCGFMTWAPIMWLGRVSFSFYLIHLIPLEAFDWISTTAVGADPTSAVPLFFVAMILPFCLAAWTHRYVELPFQRIGRRASAGVTALDGRSGAAAGRPARATGSHS